MFDSRHELVRRTRKSSLSSDSTPWGHTQRFHEPAVAIRNRENLWMLAGGVEECDPIEQQGVRVTAVVSLDCRPVFRSDIPDEANPVTGDVLNTTPRSGTEPQFTSARTPAVKVRLLKISNISRPEGRSVSVAVSTRPPS